MTRAAERQKRAAAAEAARLLSDIERDELATGGPARGFQSDSANGARDPTAAEETVSGSGRRTFGGTAAARQIPAEDDNDLLARCGLTCTSLPFPSTLLQSMHTQFMHEI